MNGLCRILAVMRVETLRLFRARASFTLLILIPAMQVLLFGYVIRPTAPQIAVAVAAPSSSSGESAARALERLPGILIVDRALKTGGAAASVDSGRALIGVEVPALRSFANPLQPQAKLRIVVDGTNPALTAAAVARIEAGYWRELAMRTGDSGAPEIRVERLYNPSSRADWTFLPSLIGVTVMIAMVMLGSLSLAREREAGTWEALLGLPIGPVELLTGKLLPYVVIGTLQGVLVLGAGVILFDLPLRGDVLALVALLPPFAAAHFTLGYAISGRARSQLAAVQGAVAFYLPAMLLSGFLYPFATLPAWAQVIGNLFPLAHFIRAAHGALLRGTGPANILAEGVPIVAFLFAMVALATIGSRRRLD